MLLDGETVNEENPVYPNSERSERQTEENEREEGSWMKKKGHCSCGSTDRRRRRKRRRKKEEEEEEEEEVEKEETTGVEGWIDCGEVCCVVASWKENTWIRKPSGSETNKSERSSSTANPLIDFPSTPGGGMTSSGSSLAPSISSLRESRQEEESIEGRDPISQTKEKEKEELG